MVLAFGLIPGVSPSGKLTTEGTMKIEVYEWKEGEGRPGSDHVHRNVCLEVLDLPSDATAPVRGDILRLRLPNINEPSSDNAWGTTPFVILEREVVCSVREKTDNSQVPIKVMAMWLFVRSIDDYTKPVALPTP